MLAHHGDEISTMSVGHRTRRAALSRLFAAFLAGFAVLAPPRVDRAEEAAVPPTVQAELLAKVAAYDRSFAARAAGRALVLIAVKPGDDDAARLGAALQKALGEQPRLGGVAHDEAVVPFTSAAALAQLTRARRAAIVYVAPGLSDEEVTALARAFDGVDVLTVTSVARQVARGVVLGFDLVSGKPKLLVHLGQARRQNVAFGAEILKLMQVYE
jgi:hypothetical protein